MMGFTPAHASNRACSAIVIEQGGRMAPRTALALAAGLIVTAAALASASAQDWPSHPVRIVVGFSPGSSADELARLVADDFSTAFGQRFYVEYRTGNSGSIAASLTARA